MREYFDQIQTVISTFDKTHANWSTNPFHTLMDNLDIWNKAEAHGFRDHHQQVSMTLCNQIDLIQQGYKAATTAEKELDEQKTFIHQQMTINHGFMAKVLSDSAISPTEETLKNMNPITKIPVGAAVQKTMSFMIENLKKIICLHQDDPQVLACAEAIQKDFNNCTKACQAKKAKSACTLISQLKEMISMLESKQTNNTSETHIMLMIGFIPALL